MNSTHDLELGGQKMTHTIIQAIRRGYNHQKWKQAISIVIEKEWKQDFTLMKFCMVMYWPICMSKVFDKVIAEKWLSLSENFLKLHQCQMKAPKKDALLMPYSHRHTR